MKFSPNHPCPCGAERKFKKCCRSFILGTPAPDPEALMRSRFTAYATGSVRYIMQTTHPDGPHFQADPDRWAEEIQHFCDRTDFEGLVVRHAQTDGDKGEVEFQALLSRDGTDCSFVERSVFERVDGVWLYREGTPQEVSPKPA